MIAMYYNKASFISTNHSYSLFRRKQNVLNISLKRVEDISKQYLLILYIIVRYMHTSNCATRNAEERRASIPGTKILQRVPQKNVKQLGSKIAKSRTKKMTTYCPNCIDEPHLCLKCFNILFSFFLLMFQ